MSSLEKARAGYGTAATPTRTGRASEYEVFARVTGRMRDAAAAPPDRGQPAGAARPGRDTRASALASALHDNRRLWTRLAADVAEPGNGLPEDLRARIFYLAEFTAQHSRKVLAGAAEPDILIEINASIMRGLRTSGTP